VARPLVRRAAAAVLVVLAALLSGAFLAAGGGLALAQAAKQPAAAPAKPKAPPRVPPDDKAILPYLTDSTLVVGRLDVDGVDVGAFERYLTKSMEDTAKAMELGPDEAKEMADHAGEMNKALRAWFDGFVAAGGHQIYVFIDGGEAMGNGDPVLVVPLGKDADAARLSGKFAELADGDDDMTAVEMGKAVVFGTRAQVDALRQHPDGAAEKPGGAAPAAWPELAEAFAAAGDAPLRVALVPRGEAGREYMDAAFSELTAETGAEGDQALLSEGLRWVTIAVTQKPSLGITLTMRAADAERAGRLETLVNKVIAFAKEQQDPGDEQAEALVKQLDAIKPKLQGETVVLRLDPALFPFMGLGMRAEGEIEVDGEPAPPAKPDDGGL
jgi:hypothetical protein